MRTINLDQLTVIGVSALEMIRIAADVGYDGFSPIAMPIPEFDFPNQPFADDEPLCRQVGQLMRSTGMKLCNVDGFLLFPHSNVARFRKPLENCARLGARSITTLFFDGDRQRAEENFLRLCEMAETVGLIVLLEFTPMSAIGNLQECVAILERINRPNSALQLDAFHLAYSGGAPSDLAQIDPRWIGSAQLCDGPRNQTPEQYAYNVVNERGLPGSGDLPLADFVKALPLDVPIGVEVPMQSLIDRGVTPLDRARLAFNATLNTLDAAARAPCGKAGRHS